MTALDTKENAPPREAWEAEIVAGHRWGQRPWLPPDPSQGERASAELARLRKLWEAAKPWKESPKEVIRQILALEICNWNLEESVLALCQAIGAKTPANLGIGHLASVSGERWKKIWAYYLALRDWLLGGAPESGYKPLLRICDPDQAVQKHLRDLLGERNKTKEPYVERFCLCLERWLVGLLPVESTQAKAHLAAVSSVDEEIKKLDPEGAVVHSGAMEFDGDGRLQPCSHKAFRRYDMILSSIGAGKWRALMPRRGTDGLDRAALLETYLSPIETWIASGGKAKGARRDELGEKIHRSLGKPDPTKVFLASLLASLLRSQQSAARKLGEARAKPS